MRPRLARPEDAGRYSVGMVVVWPNRAWLASLWRRLTWWRQVRYEVTSADAERGIVTMRAVRWSWRRWRYE